MLSKQDVLDAVAKKFKQKPWDCPKCNQHFDDYQSLAKHSNKAHGMGQKERLEGKLGDLVAHYVGLSVNNSKPDKNGKYRCPDCDASFDDARTLGKHRSEAHGHVGLVQMQMIAQPNFRFQSEREAAKKHRYRKHPLNGASCDVCGRSDFESDFALQMHRNYHVRNGDATWKNGISKGKDRKLVMSKLGMERFGNTLFPMITPFPETTPVIQPESQEIIAEVAEEPHHCDATQVLENVQRTLATVNIMIALQRMSPEQALQFSGTLNALGNLNTSVSRK